MNMAGRFGGPETFRQESGVVLAKFILRTNPLFFCKTGDKR